MQNPPPSTPIEEVSNKTPTASEYPVSISWVRKNQFIAKDELNHAIVLDTSPQSGGDGTGMSPGRLLLAAVAGCTSIDIVDILKKSRQELTELSVSARGVQNEEYPKYYKEIHLLYSLRGKNLDRSKVERAIRLSEEKYCSVGATVSGRAKIFIQYSIENESE
jgi:putative redox protein